MFLGVQLSGVFTQALKIFGHAQQAIVVHKQQKICKQAVVCSKDSFRPIQHAPESIARPDKPEDVMRECNGGNSL
jgi:hypothetical protein